MRYHFGEFTLDTDTGRLNGPRGALVLRRQAWRLLLELLERAPALISHDELLDRVWGRHALSPNVLPQTISELRRALGDRASDPRYIETLRGRGYRLACSVDTVSVAPRSPSFREANARRYLQSALVGISIVTAGVVIWLLADDTAHNTAGSAAQIVDPVTESGPAGRLRRQARQAESRHDVATAVAHWRALAALRSQDAEVLKALVRAELDDLQGEQARRSLGRLQLLPQAQDDPSVDLLDAEIAVIDNDLERALDRAESVFVAAEAAGKGPLMVEAALLRAGISKRRGDIRSGRELLVGLADEANGVLSRSERTHLLIEAAALAREEGQLGLSERLLSRTSGLEPELATRQRLQVERALLDVRNGRSGRAWQKLQVLLDSTEGSSIATDLEIALYNALGMAGIEQGLLSEASGYFQRAMSLARSSGNALRAAGVQVNAGTLLARQSRWQEADALWRRAIEVFEQIGDRRGVATCLGNLAASASSRGLNERARELNERALEHFRTLGLDGDRARTAFNLALLASRSGRLEDAETMLAEAQAAYRDQGDPELMLHVGAYRVEQRVLAGAVDEARRLLRDLDASLEDGSFLRQAAVHAARGRLALIEGNPDAARAAFERALSLREQAGHEDWVRASQLELLGLDLLEGLDPWTVRVEAEALAEHFEDSGQLRDAVRGWLIATEALLSLGEREDARAILSHAKSVAGEFEDAALSLELEWLTAWSGRIEEREPRLKTLARQARAQGFGGKVDRIRASLSERRDQRPTIRAPSRGDDADRILLPPYATAQAEDA
ncbi:tetratricopeptide repeat protein [Wenzhouxiangella sp. EGI_FJ10305]|uniref:tetratricopeptide repeat protein n=1 Tax=Wenzhouxiangella sp. EGI_FJ10305 TaxID=3243768 RepID=UPI0035DA0354